MFLFRFFANNKIKWLHDEENIIIIVVCVSTQYVKYYYIKTDQT